MNDPGLRQFFIITAAYLLRMGYCELFRLRIRNQRWVNFGDRLVAMLALGIAAWVGIELALLYSQQLTQPSFVLIATLQTGLLVTILGSGLIVILGGLLRLPLADILLGVGRGLLSFGFPIGLSALYCWLPQ
jgi:hypothetical protein